MEKMLYTSKMPAVTITLLPHGKWDVTVLVNEEEIVEQAGDTGALEETTPPEETEAVASVNTDGVPEEQPPAEEAPAEPPVEETPKVPPVNTAYQYDGNQFRTVYELTEDEVLADLDKYLNYDSDGEPTLEQLSHDHELIDSFTLELMEGGLL